MLLERLGSCDGSLAGAKGLGYRTNSLKASLTEQTDKTQPSVLFWYSLSSQRQLTSVGGHRDWGSVAVKQLACINVSLSGASVYTAVDSVGMRTAQGGTLASVCSNSTDQPSVSPPPDDVWAKTDSAEATTIAMLENRMIHGFGREFECCWPRAGVCGMDS